MAQVIKDHTEMRRSFARAERWIYVQKRSFRESGEGLVIA